MGDKSHTVLIVDDEETLCYIMKELLEEMGYPVVTAHTARDGLEVATTQHVDLILLDLKLPDGNGLNVLCEVKKAYPEIPIIIITGHAALESAVCAMKLGAFDYLAKPINLRELTNLIESALGQRAREVPEPQAFSTTEALGSFMENDTGLFLSALLHELSNTIVPVREIVQLAKRGKDTQKYLDMIESQVDLTIEILQRLRTPLVPWHLELTDLLKVVSSAQQQIAVPQDIEIEIDIPEEARMVNGNPQALLGVFVNLILNAIQAMEGGGALSVRSQVLDNEWVETRVIDTGCGITAEIQDKLFEPFFTTRKKEGGQGLGLWLSRKSVERLGGSLVLEKSEPGEGTTFVMRLPLADRVSGDSERAEKSDET